MSIDQPFLEGEPFVDIYNVDAINTPADIPHTIALRTLRLANYLVLNHKLVTKHFSDTLVCTDTDEDTGIKSTALTLALRDSTILAVNSDLKNLTKVATINLYKNAAISTKELNSEFPSVVFQFGSNSLVTNSGCEYAPRTMERLWNTADDFVKLLFWVHQEITA
ncbi:MAG: hypothetical protein WCJ60_00345 [bacterium]